MITLTSTTDKIQVVLGPSVTTNQLSCYASYKDVTTSSISPLRNTVSTNNTTQVDLVASPGSSTQRILDFLSIFNTDTTAKTVTISLYNGTTNFTLFKANILVGESIIYQEGDGFSVNTTTGGRKVTNSAGVGTITGTGLQMVTIGSDVINNNASANTIQDVTGLKFPVINGGRYYFKFVIFYTAAATTTGSRWCVNATAGTSSNLSFMSEYSLTTTTSTRNAQVGGFNSPSSCNATSASTTANHCIMEGYITATSDSDIQATFASEVSSSAITAKAGSFVIFQRLS